MGASHAADASPRVEVLVFLWEDEFTRVQVYGIVLGDEFEVCEGEEAGEVGVVVRPVAAHSVDLVREDFYPIVLDYSITVYAFPYSIGML